MWRLRLVDMQNVDDGRRQPLGSPRVCEVRRQQRLSRRRMSISDMRSERLMTERPAALLYPLPHLFSRLIASFSRSLAFLAPLPTSDEPTSEPLNISLDDEVD